MPTVKLKLGALFDVPPVVPAVIVVAVALLLDIFTVGVPVNVRPVAVAVVQTVPEPVVVILPVPKVIARVVVLEEENAAQLKVDVLVPTSKVPLFKVTVPVAVIALGITYVGVSFSKTPSSLIDENDFPLVVMVLEAKLASVIVLALVEALNDPPDGNDKLPVTVKVEAAAPNTIA